MSPHVAVVGLDPHAPSGAFDPDLGLPDPFGLVVPGGVRLDPRDDVDLRAVSGGDVIEPL